MSSPDLILRLRPMQVMQLVRLLKEAEDYAISGKGLRYLAVQGSAERLAWLDLQIGVQELYRAVLQKGQPA